MNATHHMSPRRRRPTLWFANGVVTALALTTVFIGVRATAAPSADESTFVPIVPCRLFDTRPGADNVGPRDSPFPQGSPITMQVTGENGNCDIPTTATGVAMNVTAVNATARSFMQVFPDDATRPVGSNLNFVAGQAPFPNKVDTKLSATGSVAVYNHQGTVDALADIVGYYTTSGLADIVASLALKADAADVHAKDDVYTKAEVEGRTVTRSISIPARALADNPAQAGIDPSSNGYSWMAPSIDELTASVFVPADYVAGTPIKVELFISTWDTLNTAGDPFVMDLGFFPRTPGDGFIAGAWYTHQDPGEMGPGIVTVLDYEVDHAELDPPLTDGDSWYFLLSWPGTTGTIDVYSMGIEYTAHS